MNLREGALHIAPGKEGLEKLKLDIVVVVPVYNEPLPNVIRNVESIVAQKKRKDDPFLHGCVITINSKPPREGETKEEKLARDANQRVYNALQFLRHGVKVTLGDKELDASIDAIQNSGIPIEIVFADHHPDNNVGRARQWGAEHALKMLNMDERTDWRAGQQPVLMWTDADSELGDETLHAVWCVFSNEENVGAAHINANLDAKHLDESSRQAHAGIDTYWKVSSAVHEIDYQTDALRGRFFYKPKEQKQHAGDVVALGGAGMAVAAKDFVKTGGVRPIAGGEDTRLGWDIIDKTGKEVVNLQRLYPKARVLTQPRVSNRTSTGFGLTIGKWSDNGETFGDKKVGNPKATEVLEGLFMRISKSRELAKQFNWTREEQERDFKEYMWADNFSAEEINDLWQRFSKWDGRLNTEEHYSLVKHTNDVFHQKYPDIPMSTLIEQLERKNNEYSNIAFSQVFRFFKDESLPKSVLRWDDFVKYYDDVFAGLGIQRSNNVEQVEMGTRLRAIRASAYGVYLQKAVEEFWREAINMIGAGFAKKPSAEDAGDVVKAALEPHKYGLFKACSDAELVSCTREIVAGWASLLEVKLTSDEKRRFAQVLLKLEDDEADAWNEYGKTLEPSDLVHKN